MKLVMMGLGAGGIAGMLVMTCALPFFSKDSEELFKKFYAGVGFGIGIGFSTTLAVMVFNWFIGTADRIKSGKF